MSDALPDFQPLPLTGLSWSAAKHSARLGMEIRRAHWCSPVVIWDGGLMLDDDGELSGFEPTAEDQRAQDWASAPRALSTPETKEAR